MDNLGFTRQDIKGIRCIFAIDKMCFTGGYDIFGRLRADSRMCGQTPSDLTPLRGTPPPAQGQTKHHRYDRNRGIPISPQDSPPLPASASVNAFLRIYPRTHANHRRPVAPDVACRRGKYFWSRHRISSRLQASVAATHNGVKQVGECGGTTGVSR